MSEVCGDIKLETLRGVEDAIVERNNLHDYTIRLFRHVLEHPAFNSEDPDVRAHLRDWADEQAWKLGGYIAEDLNGKLSFFSSY